MSKHCYLTKNGVEDIIFSKHPTQNDWYNVSLSGNIVGVVVKEFGKWRYIVQTNIYLDINVVPKHLRVGKGFATRLDCAMFMLDLLECHVETQQNIEDDINDSIRAERMINEIVRANDTPVEYDIKALESCKRWTHHRGDIYTIQQITNRLTQDRIRFPVTVVYSDKSGAIWSRPMVDFVSKFTPLSETK